MESLLLIPEKYPFGSGETFIDNELPTLSQVFDVTIMPLGPVSSQQKGSVPCVAKVITPITHIRGKLRLLLHGIAHVWACLPYLSSEDFNWYLRHPWEIRRLIALASKVADARRQIRFALENQPVGLIYTYWFDAGTIAALLESRGSIKVVTRAHGFDIYPERQDGWIPLRNWAMAKIDRVFVISRHGYDALITSYPGSADKVMLNYLGTIDHGVAQAERSSQRVTIVSLSNLVPVKRVDLLIDSLAHLGRQSPYSIRWIHIGDGPCRQDLEERARQLLSHVEWQFVGHLDNAAAIELMKTEAPDFLASTSDSEGLPVSVMEAMSLGIPVIAPPVGGIPEIVRDSVTGFLTQPNPSAQDVCAAMMNWLSLPDSAKSAMRNAARQCWEDRFRAENQARQFARQLDEVVGKL